MKITQIEPTPIPFKPVVITLETQEEVDMLHYTCAEFEAHSSELITFLKVLKDGLHKIFH